MKTLLFVLFLPTTGGAQRMEHLEDHLRNIDASTEEAIQNRRRLDMKVNVCVDAINYFGWDDGDNFLRLYHNCECSGDLKKDFLMKCEMKNHCFKDEDGIDEQCISRTNIYNFHVDSDSGSLKELRGVTTMDTYESGFLFGGNFTSISATGCINDVRNHFPDLGMGQIIEVCNENCEAFLSKNQYAQERIRELCPATFVDGVKCNSAGRVSCRKQKQDDPNIYLSTPDCSNVYPCLTSSCQGYPQVDTTPQRHLYNYPKCNMGVIPDDKIPYNDSGKSVPVKVIGSSAFGSSALSPFIQAIAAISIFHL